MTTFPVLPPALFRVLPRPEAALEMAGPAEEETRERPSWALEAEEEADSVALEAVSEVEEACLTAVLRVRNCDCRSTARDAVAGILITTGIGRWKKEGVDLESRRRGRGESNGGLVKSRRAIAGPSRFEAGKFREFAHIRIT